MVRFSYVVHTSWRHVGLGLCQWRRVFSVHLAITWHSINLSDGGLKLVIASSLSECRILALVHLTDFKLLVDLIRLPGL